LKKEKKSIKETYEERELEARVKDRLKYRMIQKGT
jgi:hypothetical protein